MAITLATNIAASRSERALAGTSSKVRLLHERLSSGQRINRASDDAAGLSISESLNVDARVYGQAARNINDAISLTAIAEGALEQLTSIVIRIRELASQAANGALGAAQRKSIDTEAQALSKEYVRIAQTTSFNGLRLFSAAAGDVDVQAGYGVQGQISSSLGGAVATGDFSTANTYLEGIGSHRSIAAGDFNGDGIADLVDTGLGAFGEARILLGTGDGKFVEGERYLAHDFNLTEVVLGDINGDGVLDFATCGYRYEGGEVAVFIGKGDGSFTRAEDFLTPEPSNYTLDLADFDNDGKLDLAVTGANLHVYRGAGDGTFSLLQSLTPATIDSGHTRAISVGDLNSDGSVDIVTGGWGDLTVFMGDGRGGFTRTDTYAATISGTETIRLGDINGDGRLDLVTAGWGYAGPEGAVLLGSGNGSFSAAATFATESPGMYSFDLVLADISGDGNLDLVTSGENAASVFFGDGSGRFEKTGNITLSSGDQAVACADFNGDGVLDPAFGHLPGRDPRTHAQQPRQEHEQTAARQTTDDGGLSFRSGIAPKEAASASTRSA